MRVVIGVTGPNAAGKGEVSAYFRRHGFQLHSLSDIVREAAAERGFPPEREHLIRVGTELRERGGAGVLAERLLGRLGNRDVVDSVRNPAEVDVLRTIPEFVLIGVRASAELRFARSRSRARPGDPETFDAFLAREAQENSRNPAGQQLQATFALADRIVDNDAGLPELHAQLDEVLRSLGVPTPPR